MASAYNQNVGSFYLQMETAQGEYTLVQCSLGSGGAVTSATLSSGYRIAALEFDEQRDSLVGIVQHDDAKYYAAVVSPNGTVTPSGGVLSPTHAGDALVEGVSVYMHGESAGSGVIIVLFASTTAEATPEYEVISVDPFTGVVGARGTLNNPSKSTILQLGYA